MICVPPQKPPNKSHVDAPLGSICLPFAQHGMATHAPCSLHPFSLPPLSPRPSSSPALPTAPPSPLPPPRKPHRTPQPQPPPPTQRPPNPRPAPLTKTAKPPPPMRAQAKMDAVMAGLVADASPRELSSRGGREDGPFYRARGGHSVLTVGRGKAETAGSGTRIAAIPDKAEAAQLAGEIRAEAVTSPPGPDPRRAGRQAPPLHKRGRPPRGEPTDQAAGRPRMESRSPSFSGLAAGA